ncbi:MAG: ATP-binding protein [Chloroflexi bacterium]|nr:ATP-binding protein [Chloroflexota bacterium]
MTSEALVRSSQGVSRDALVDLRLRLGALRIYRGVLADPPGQMMLALLGQLTGDKFPEEETLIATTETFAQLGGALLAEAARAPQGLWGDPWQEHLVNRLLADANPFSQQAEGDPAAAPSGGLLAAVQAELHTLQALHELSLTRLQEALVEGWPERAERLRELWPDLDPLVPPAPENGSGNGGLGGMRRRLREATDWATLAPKLAQFYAQMGTGLFSQYRSFRWVMRDGAGALEGIPAPDPIRIEELIGYEREQEMVLRNTRHFVQGAPGNNVLLYGDSGTGKSSLVKALLNAFGDSGLRLVEVPKEHLTDFPYIARALRGRRERFILFVDDFSFEEHETEYKALKALLEGSLEARPRNVLIYATSNRRHLVKEQFSDRSAPGDEDVRPHETVQEKLSLADRFGIRVAFLTPDQPRYLAIALALARREGIALPSEEVQRRALQWAQWQHGFSGRTARQFVDDLLGELQAGPAPGQPGGVPW